MFFLSSFVFFYTEHRPSRDEPLQFSVVGGYETKGGGGIFISKVERGSKADDIGLKRGDQILEVNGQSFEHGGVKQARALEVLKGVCHLSITVKSNLLAFQEMHLQQVGGGDNLSQRTRGRGSKSVHAAMSNHTQSAATSGGLAANSIFFVSFL